MTSSFKEEVEAVRKEIILDVDGCAVIVPHGAMPAIAAFAEDVESDFEAVERFYDDMTGNPVKLVRQLFGDYWAELKEQIRDENGKVPPVRVGILLRLTLEEAGLKN